MGARGLQVSGEDKRSERQVLILIRSVVGAFVRNNSLPPEQLAELVSKVGDTVTRLIDPVEEPEPTRAKPTRAQIRASIKDTELISFEDGQSYAMLRRHLTHRGLTPSAYRMKWALPLDYPMVAPLCSKKRAALAQETDLGHHERGAALAEKNKTRPPPGEGGRPKRGGPVRDAPLR